MLKSVEEVFLNTHLLVLILKKAVVKIPKWVKGKCVALTEQGHRCMKRHEDNFMCPMHKKMWRARVLRFELLFCCKEWPRNEWRAPLPLGFHLMPQNNRSSLYTDPKLHAEYMAWRKTTPGFKHLLEKRQEARWSGILIRLKEALASIGIRNLRQLAVM